jgi:hypothetical protein
VRERYISAGAYFYRAAYLLQAPLELETLLLSAGRLKLQSVAPTSRPMSEFSPGIDSQGFGQHPSRVR